MWISLLDCSGAACATPAGFPEQLNIQYVLIKLSQLETMGFGHTHDPMLERHSSRGNSKVSQTKP